MSAESKALKVALVGNPNAGKTSLFNQLTGLKQKVGNFAGVTVDKKKGYCRLDKFTEAEIIDLPGTYSIYPKSRDEHVVADYLANTLEPEYPDVVVIILDETSIKRNLLLFSQVVDLGVPFVVALNMVKQAEKANIKIEKERFDQLLGINAVEIDARRGIGISRLKHAILEPDTSCKWTFYDAAGAMGEDAEQQIKSHFICKTSYHALQHLLQTRSAARGYSDGERQSLIAIRNTLQKSIAELKMEEVRQRYESIDAFLDRLLPKRQENNKQLRVSQMIDRVVIHPLWGFLLFFFVLAIIFQSVFSLASYPMDWIDTGISLAQSALRNVMKEGMLTDLLVDGIIAGIGGVVIFIPQIAFLFLLIGLLEESGYMSRVMFIMDKLMRGFGLNGRSVVPLVSSAACAVPAIMSARSIENPRDRIITIFVSPLISCSARLPVYALLIGIAVPNETVLGFINVQGLALLGLYALGFAAALLTAFIMKGFVTNKGKSFFIIEMPAYRWPHFKNIAHIVFDKSKSFVWEAGRIILAISIVLWVLSTFGPGDAMLEAENSIKEEYASMSSDSLQNKIDGARLEASYIGHFGRAIEPAIKPLGYDWKIGIALITSFAAREVFVGTISTVYSVGSDDDGTIKERLAAQINPATGQKVFNIPTSMSLLIFYAFAMQCMSTVAITKKETASWKWAILQLLYMTGLAYVCALISFQLLS